MNGARKQTGIDTQISDKADFKEKLIRKDKEGHFILVKGTIQQEFKIFILQNWVQLNYVKEILIKLKL